MKLKAQALQFCQKEAPTQVFSCEFCKIVENIYFVEILLMIASERFTKLIPVLRRHFKF